MNRRRAGRRENGCFVAGRFRKTGHFTFSARPAPLPECIAFESRSGPEEILVQLLKA